jgi:hypothetical protein
MCAGDYKRVARRRGASAAALKNFPGSKKIIQLFSLPQSEK